MEGIREAIQYSYQRLCSKNPCCHNNIKYTHITEDENSDDNEEDDYFLDIPEPKDADIEAGVILLETLFQKSQSTSKQFIAAIMTWILVRDQDHYSNLYDIVRVSGNYMAEILIEAYQYLRRYPPNPFLAFSIDRLISASYEVLNGTKYSKVAILLYQDVQEGSAVQQLIESTRHVYTAKNLDLINLEPEIGTLLYEGSQVVVSVGTLMIIKIYNIPVYKALDIEEMLNNNNESKFIHQIRSKECLPTTNTSTTIAVIQGNNNIELQQRMWGSEPSLNDSVRIVLIGPFSNDIGIIESTSYKVNDVLHLLRSELFGSDVNFVWRIVGSSKNYFLDLFKVVNRGTPSNELAENEIAWAGWMYPKLLKHCEYLEGCGVNRVKTKNNNDYYFTLITWDTWFESIVLQQIVQVLKLNSLYDYSLHQFVFTFDDSKLNP